MTKSCGYDNNDCNEEFPRQAAFEAYLAFYQIEGKVNFTAINHAPKAPGTNGGASVTVHGSSMATDGGDGASDTTTPAPASGPAGPAPAGTPRARRLLEQEISDGSPPFLQEIVTLFSTVTKAEFEIADTNGDGLSKMEAIGLFLYKKTQRGDFKKDKYALLAMAKQWMIDDKAAFDEGLESNAELLTGADLFYAGGADPLSWPEKAERKHVDDIMAWADLDNDDKMNMIEAAVVGFSGDENNLFTWLDMNSDGFVTFDEGFGIYETIIEDGQMGKYVCDGLEIIDATSGKLDVRAPMGVGGNACGWLIMPSWFYASKEAPEHQEVSSPKDTSSYTVRSARTVLPRAATASLRSKAHRRNAHELNTKEVIKSAARKLLQSTDPPPTGSSGSLDATGNSGSVDDASFLARISFMGEHMCSGALIGPNHVLTTASCVRKFENHENHTGFSYEGLTVSILGDADGSGSGSASGSGDDFHIHLIHVHPSAAFDMEFDMAIVELHGSSTAKPAQLYDGGDLGISDCKKMTLSYLSWAVDMTAEMTKVQLTDHKDCQEAYHEVTGSEYDEMAGMGMDGGVNNAEICVSVPNSFKGPCFHDLGLPLTASKIKGRTGSWLLGLAHADHCGEGMDLPAVFTRVSSSLQWIRATLPELSVYPEQFDMTLEFSALGLPEGAYVTVHSGPNFNSESIVEEGTLDSKCMVPWSTTVTTNGAMLIMLHMEHKPNTPCDKECIDTMGLCVCVRVRACACVCVRVRACACVCLRHP